MVRASLVPLLTVLSSMTLLGLVACGGEDEPDTPGTPGTSSGQSGSGGQNGGSSGQSGSGGQNGGSSGVNPGDPVDCAEPPCSGGAECTKASDCASSICQDERCVDASATDGVKNGTETDVDCGGANPGTPRCDESKQCLIGTDCRSVVCTGNRCQAPSATDGVKNGTETDVDCGGGAPTNAPACDSGKACTVQEDCAAVRCTDNLCQPPSASDGLRNGTETDVDCGGGAPTNAPRCLVSQSCSVSGDCDNVLCSQNTCQPASAADGLKNGTETDVDCGGGAPTNAPRCASGKACQAQADCNSVLCTNNLCAQPTAVDGLQNGTETDVDCGGGAPTNAPVCNAGQRCAVGTDCDSRFCDAIAGVCEPRMPGRKDGDETDVDCGGLVAPACAWGLQCLRDADCGSASCAAGSCQAPSAGVGPGRNTCGPQGAANEDCARSLPLTNYPLQGGKQVYLDKYEITPGRMRQFLAAAGPNVRNFMSGRRPARWNLAWEAVLPTADGGAVTFTITNPTRAHNAGDALNPAYALTGFLYPGQDVNAPLNTQTGWNVISGSYSIYPNVVRTFGSSTWFPEYQDPYAAVHAFNCNNEKNSYGFGTFWLSAADQRSLVESSTAKERVFSQAQLDAKALNCTPMAMFAAFCAWDGGQLVTRPVINHLISQATIGTWANDSQRFSTAANCRTSVTAADTINVTGDGGAGGCYKVFYDGGDSYDDAGRVAPPGRVAADVLRVVPGDEGWRDLMGNLVEAVSEDNDRFGAAGFGVGHASILAHHRTQIMTPRFKNASMGGRCMRLK